MLILLISISSSQISVKSSKPEYIYKSGKEQTNVRYYIKVGGVEYTIPYINFVNQSSNFGFDFNKTEIINSIKGAGKTFDSNIYYNIDSNQEYIKSPNTPYMLERNLTGTANVTNQIGQIEERQIKRFISFEDVFKKDLNIYNYSLKEINRTDCTIGYNAIDECINNLTSTYPVNITIKQRRNIGFSFIRKGMNWITKFYNLFYLDPSFIDDNESDWDAGTFINMERVGTGSNANLSSAGTNTSGEYISQIFNATAEANWTNITWTTQYPYGEEMPNDAVDVAWGNMTGNVLLMHFNNDSAYGEHNTHVYDFSGSGNNGTVTGAVVNTIDCKFGNCFTFDGSNDYIRVSHSTSYKPTTTITVNVWAKPSTTSQPAWAAIITSPYRTSGWSDPFTNWNIVRFSDNDYVKCGVTVGVSDYWAWDDTGTEFTTNAWFMTTLVYDGETLDCYINGVATSTNTAPSGDISYAGGNADLVFGVRSPYSLGEYYKGLTDEVAIWNRSLSADEIKNLYMRGAARLNLSVRSCDDSACSGESFTQINKDNTNGTFGRKITNLSEYAGNNQYFQYNFSYWNRSSTTQVIVENLTIEYFLTAVEDTTPPILSYVDPTDINVTVTTRNWSYINISSNEALDNATLEWNGTINYSMFNLTSTIWWYNVSDLVNFNYTYYVFANDTSNINPSALWIALTTLSAEMSEAVLPSSSS